ncbi:calcium/sodium antiporter [Geitlerinema sp. P-1104]|uniref:calcium/sodium antiporter n=1 Tax=Geitlerinema sp. P-1104 TaxID=2546230 RepID=UPI0014772787|nr:calcium/sodium antiporter [Geitlerinema sp. P-1104]NMG59223.1 calcium/sodium antiporter [Geitlerinema sp. P-1104]
MASVEFNLRLVAILVYFSVILKLGDPLNFKMLDLLTWLGIFAVSLFVLIKASDWFIDSSEVLGVFLRLSPFIIGVAIVSVGTSLPELMSSITAVQEGSSEIVFGNVIGSNVANIFLITGVAAVVAGKMELKYDLTSVDLPLFVGSSFLLALMLFTGKYSVGEAVLCLLAYGVYLIYTITTSEGEIGGIPISDAPVEAKSEATVAVGALESTGPDNGSPAPLETNPTTEAATSSDDSVQHSKTDAAPEAAERQAFPWKALSILVVSVVLIYFGAKYTVESVVALSELLNIGKEIIAVSALALGTSLPELSVSLVCVKRGSYDVAIGNVLGSNIFNALVVMAIPRFFGALIIPKTTLIEGLLEMLCGTILMFFVVQDKQITRWEGYLFIIFYAWFIAQIFDLV